MRIAITRAVSPRIANAELTFLEREPIDPGRAATQHEIYEQWLEAHGCRLMRAQPAPEHPDGVFVEDTAIVLDEVAVVTRPGAVSRRMETESVARTLVRYRAVRSLEDPGTLDGGDVLRIGHTLYVGMSRRTNNRAIAQLRDVLAPLGYTVVPTPFRDCLHLKTAVTAIDRETIVYNPEWVEAHHFRDVNAIPVDAAEPRAANVLGLNGTLLVPASHPRTRALLEKRGYSVDAIDYDELEKAEAGVTCCSIIFDS